MGIRRKDGILSVMVVCVISFSMTVVAQPGIAVRPEITLADIARVKEKYPRVVLFGDSELDTGNITKKFNLGVLGRNFEQKLPMGAPFTSGTGDVAQQLFEKDFYRANPMDWGDKFSPLGYDVEFRVYSGDKSNIAVKDKKFVDMAQGGGKLVSDFPGEDRKLLRGIALQVVSAVKDKLPSWLAWVFQEEVIADLTIDRMVERNITLINKIVDQPEAFKKAGGVFGEHDLAMIMAGGNDVIEQGYSGARSFEKASKDLSEGRKKLLEDIAAQGAKHIFFGNIPDLRVTPEYLDWKPGQTNTLHLGVALSEEDAHRNMSRLMFDANEQAMVAALGAALKNPGINITIFDAFKLLSHISNNSAEYGINSDKKAYGLGGYLTEDGLHPSEETSKIIADSYRNYLRDPNEVISAHAQGRGYDAYLDSFVDITSVEENGVVIHQINNGVLDLSLRGQAEALSKTVKLNGGILYFDGEAENFNDRPRTSQLDVDLLVSKEVGGGIEVDGEASELIYTGSASNGPLLKSGSGKLVLAADNDLSLVYVVGGALQVGNGGDQGWLQGNVDNYSTLIFNRSDNKVFSGAINGTGDLIKNGFGLLNLTGNGDISGKTWINQGQLAVNAAFNNTDVSVAPGARLSGVGSVRSVDLQPGAAIAPGNSIGLFTVQDDIKFAKGSIYEVEVDAASQSDEIRAGGTANIEGGEVQVNAADGNYADKSLYTILSAAKQVNGQFEQVSTNLAFLEPTLIYHPAAVSLQLIRNSIKLSSFCQGQNQMAACAPLDSVASQPTTSPVESAAPAPVEAVEPVSAPAVAQPTTSLVESAAPAPVEAVELVSAPAVAQPTTSLVESAAPAPVEAVELVSAPAVAQPTTSPVESAAPAPVEAVAPVSAPAVAQTTPPVTTVQTSAPTAAVSSSPQQRVPKEIALIEGMSSAEVLQLTATLPADIHPSIQTVLLQESSFVQSAVTKRMFDSSVNLLGQGAWGYAFGSEGKQQGTDNIASMSRRTNGFVLGNDVLIEDKDLILGVVGGYQQSNLSQGLGSADVKTFHLGAYGNKRYDALSVRLGANLAWHEIESRRKVYYKGHYSALKADYHGRSAQVFSELAYGLNLGEVVLEPYAGVSYTRLDVSGFSEKKELFAVKGKQESKDLSAGTLGVRLNHSKLYSQDIKVDFQGGAGLKHIFSGLSSNTDMQYRSIDGEFGSAGLPLKRDTLQLNAKVVAQHKSGLAVGLDYTAERASGMRDQVVSAFASWQF